MNQYTKQYHSKTLLLDELDNFISNLPRVGMGDWAEIKHLVVHGDSATIIWEQEYGRIVD
jgi:hypothetical protein